MPTVAEVMLQALHNLDALVTGMATGGSTSTIVDSALATLGLNYAGDHFKEGRAFVIRSTDGLAPQGQSRRVTGFTAGSGTIAVSPVFSAAPEAGDHYAVSTKRFPAGIVLGKLNEFLAEAGAVPTEDTSLTTVGGQMDYALPAAAKFDLRQVWLARNTAAPYNYEPLTHWRTEPGAPGAAGNLHLDYMPRAGCKLKLVYLARHADVYADSDPISEYIGIEWAAIATAVRLARWRINQAGDDAARMGQQINDLLAREPVARARSRRAWPEALPRFPYVRGG